MSWEMQLGNVAVQCEWNWGMQLGMQLGYEAGE